jgi:hypothetical protein
MAFADRQTRRRTAHKMERAFDQMRETFAAIQEAIDEDETSNEQREWNDRDRRRESDEHVREREEDRKDIRLVVEVEERRRALRHKDVLLVLTVILVFAAIVLAFVAVKQKDLGYAGVSLFATLLSACGAYLIRAVQRPKRETEPADAGAPDPPQPFRWGILSFQSELEEEEGSPG